MERKIGEIFEYNGEWYQCVERNKDKGCHGCAFLSHNLCGFNGDPHCIYRSDSKPVIVIFKKLEKVGEQFLYKGKQMQSYIRATDELIWNNNLLLLEHVDSDIIDIEIKQNKEDMEEKKLNLKPFDIQKAREGKPVCTRDGRKARIICFDRINGDYYKIIACVTAFDGDFEEVLFYGIDGYIVDSQNPKDEDLMILPEKKEGWVNVYKNQIHDTPKSAEEGHKGIIDYIKTIRVEWEE